MPQPQSVLHVGEPTRAERQEVQYRTLPAFANDLAKWFGGGWHIVEAFCYASSADVQVVWERYVDDDDTTASVSPG